MDPRTCNYLNYYCQEAHSFSDAATFSPVNKLEQNNWSRAENKWLDECVTLNGNTISHLEDQGHVTESREESP